MAWSELQRLVVCVSRVVVCFCWSVICSGCRFYATTVALFGVLCFSRFPRCCQSSSKRCVRQLLLRQSSLNRCSRQVLLRPVGIRPLISPLVTGSGIASVTGGRIWSSRGRVSGGPRTNTARPWLCHRRRDHCQADCERRDEEKFSHAVSYIYTRWASRYHPSVL